MLQGPVYGPVAGSGRAQDNFQRGVGSAEVWAPLVDGPAQGNFLPVADPEQGWEPLGADRSQGNFRRAGQG
jgi:hypothetical protein